MSSVNDRQVGGDHYKAPLQHWDWVELNKLRYLEGCATKYVARSRKKHDTPKVDLEKAIHYVQKLIELHEAGIINPRISETVKSVDELVVANSLNVDEEQVIRIITYWRDKDDLERAVEHLRWMLK
jgi:predicted transcriptional regulator